jgi:hypothetical protein
MELDAKRYLGEVLGKQEKHPGFGISLAVSADELKPPARGH